MLETRSLEKSAVESASRLTNFKVPLTGLAFSWLFSQLLYHNIFLYTIILIDVDHASVASVPSSLLYGWRYQTWPTVLYLLNIYASIMGGYGDALHTASQSTSIDSWGTSMHCLRQAVHILAGCTRFQQRCVITMYHISGVEKLNAIVVWSYSMWVETMVPLRCRHILWMPKAVIDMLNESFNIGSWGIGQIVKKVPCQDEIWKKALRN